MQANISALMKLADDRGWSTPELAVHLQINYSYLFRILKGQKQGGARLFAGIYRLCQQEGLSLENYISFEDKVNSSEG